MSEIDDIRNAYRYYEQVVPPPTLQDPVLIQAAQQGQALRNLDKTPIVFTQTSSPTTNTSVTVGYSTGSGTGHSEPGILDSPYAASAISGFFGSGIVSYGITMLFRLNVNYMGIWGGRPEEVLLSLAGIGASVVFGGILGAKMYPDNPRAGFMIGAASGLIPAFAGYGIANPTPIICKSGFDPAFPCCPNVC